jgi:MscS family membrane protein
VDQVREVLLGVAGENTLVLAEPTPRVRLRSFGDSSLDFELLCWTGYPKDKGRLIHQLNSAIFKEFKRTGIDLPTPQRDLFLHAISDRADHYHESHHPEAH